jgi:hypothetical protein
MSSGTQGRWRLVGFAVAVLSLVLVLTACLAPEASQATPTPTKTPRPLPVLATVTCTPVPTEPATATPEPTSPPTLPPTTLPDPTVTPLPTLAADLCPLTGLPVTDLALLERRPLAIKVQNAEASRPQFGLPKADIVYEHLESQAAYTRFTALYLCQPVGKIGSVRSARFIDLELPAMYKSLFAFSGVCPGLYPKFKAVDFKDREFWYDQGIHSEAFYRDKELRQQGVPIEHTLFADAGKIWQIAADLGINQPQDLSGMTFDPAPPAGGEPATHISIPYPARTMVAEYRYDPARGVYLRWNGGEPHVDAASGEQITATNVIVAYATHVDASFYEDPPRNRWPSVQIQFWDSGPALIFRDGRVYEGLWARPERDDMVVFRDPTGQVPIPLKPGNTWISLVPLPGHKWSFEATWDDGG